MDDSSGLAHYQRHIIRDPKICGGEPVFKGTRVTLRTVLASLATGDTPEAIFVLPQLEMEKAFVR